MREERRFGKFNCARRIKNTWRRENTARTVVGKDVDGKPVFERITMGKPLRQFAREMAAGKAGLLTDAARQWLRNKKKGLTAPEAS